MISRFILPALFLLSLTQLNAQSGFETLKDNDGTKMLKGMISRDILESDTSFSWYTTGRKFYKPNAETVAALKKNGDSLQLVVFMGTWCEDSHFVIPKFFTLTDAAGFSNDRISMIAVDRNKKTVSHLAEAWNVVNVPTIIVMKKGKEIGRVVEYGKSGLFDKDLGELINPVP